MQWRNKYLYPETPMPVKLQILSLASLISLLAAACNAPQTLRPLPSMFSPDNLPTQTLTINTDKDTAITLQSGTIITFPAQALKPATGTTARIEVKEALAIADIIRAGLRTQSNGLPLQSAGMIYINAPGQQVTIQRPIGVKIPAMDRLPGMMRYKGQETPNGINWVDPEPLPAQQPKIDVWNGRRLFQQACASCHMPLRKLTGPALYGTMQRWGHDTAAVFAFTKNAAQVLNAGNKYACCLYKSYGQQAMPAFPTFTQQDLQEIYAYIDREGKRAFGQVPAHLMVNQCDSCDWARAALDSMDRIVTDTRTYFNFESRPEPMDVGAGYASGYIDISQLTEDTLPPDTAPTPARRTTSSTSRSAGPSPAYVEPSGNKGAYYNLELTAFGWYNLDILAKDFASYEQARLSVSVTGKATAPAIFLIIPDYKIFVEGGLLKDGKAYGFHTTDGDISLPMGVNAYIIAIAEDGVQKQLYYGQQSFITTYKQSLSIQLQAAGNAEINSRLQNLQFKGVELRQDTLVMQQHRIWKLIGACSCGNQQLPAAAAPK